MRKREAKTERVERERETERERESHGIPSNDCVVARSVLKCVCVCVFMCVYIVMAGNMLFEGPAHPFH